ncbi:MAG: ATP-grasp domain-containing protein [Chitinophagaceae bacterium]
MKKFKVLIFPCGAENALEIYESLKTNVSIEAIGASSVEDHGRYAFEQYIGGLPNISHPEFIDLFNTILGDWGIDLIFPTHDTVALFFSENQHRIKATVICSEYETSLYCREKRRTYALFKDQPFVPRQIDVQNGSVDYPVFVKPNIGEGAKNAALVADRAALDFYRSSVPDLLVLEYLPGTELTVDCFTDRKGVLRFIGPRTRQRIKMGISFHSDRYELTSEIKSIGDIINKKLKFRGLWFFQLRQDKSGKFKLLEISTRCAGTMSLYRQLGVNFSLLSVFDAAGLDVEILINDNHIELDRCLFARYRQDVKFRTLYIDFDDTVIINGRVNYLAIRLLYQCIEQGKKITLITRHEKDIYATLKEMRISEYLFDEIICLKPEDSKGDHIHEANAIFIDNAFKERKIVKEKLGIPVFDVDAIPSLIL